MTNHVNAEIAVSLVVYLFDTRSNILIFIITFVEVSYYFKYRGLFLRKEKLITKSALLIVKRSKK